MCRRRRPALAAAGDMVIARYLRGYGTTQFPLIGTFRNARQLAVALDLAVEDGTPRAVNYIGTGYLSGASSTMGTLRLDINLSGIQMGGAEWLACSR